ncbi:MAG TPA: hypothetical protein VGK67_15030 [Myxococcales bacterium]|jgi:hypothetical protein
MKRCAFCLVVAAALSIASPSPARADDTANVLLGLGIGQVALNGLSTLTFAAVDLTYAVRGRKLNKGWAIPQLIFGSMSVVAGGINFAIGAGLGRGSGGDLFMGLGTGIAATGIFYVVHAAYHLSRGADPEAPAVAPPPPPLAVYFLPTKNGAVTGLSMVF